MTELVDVEADDAASVVDVEADDAQQPPPARLDRVLLWIGRRSIADLLITSAIVLYAAYFTRRSLDAHHALGTASYDSALYDQGVWLLSRFEAPFVTLMGRNLFGDHTSFILLFLVPLYWIAPGAWILFFSQSAAIAAGAIPVYLLGRKRLSSDWFALVAALAYLVHPAVGFTNLENFHPDSYLGVLVGFAIYFAIERRWRLYAVFVVLSLMVKEDVSLVIVPLGIWVALKRDRRIGLVTIFGSIWFMYVAMFVVMRGLIGVPTRNGWRLPFSEPGDTAVRAAGRFVVHAVTNPTELFDHLRADGRPWYLWQMTAPFAWIFLRLPTVAAISGVVLFTNVLSTFGYQFQIEFHYALVAVPALAMGTVYALGEVRDRAVGSRRLGLAVAAFGATSLLTSYLWAPMPWGRTYQWFGEPDNIYATTMREIVRSIPDDASVAAHYRVTPHLAYRKEIYQFPTPFRAVLYGVDDSLGGARLVERAEGVDFVVMPTSKAEGLGPDWEVIAEAFDEVDRNEIWVLYERNRSVELPVPGSGFQPGI